MVESNAKNADAMGVTLPEAGETQRSGKGMAIFPQVSVDDN
jgi:hypothetical protein